MPFDNSASALVAIDTQSAIYELASLRLVDTDNQARKTMHSLKLAYLE